jgi:hypothetical protein
MKFEDEPTKQFRIYRTDINNEPFECVGAYNTAAEVRAHNRRPDRRYKIEVHRTFYTVAEFDRWVKDHPEEQ